MDYVIDMYHYYYKIHEQYHNQYPKVIRQTRVVNSKLSKPIKIAYVSEKIWCEHDDEIIVTKDRFKQTPYSLSEEEIKEFRWIKLTSVDM